MFVIVTNEASQNVANTGALCKLAHSFIVRQYQNEDINFLLIYLTKLKSFKKKPLKTLKNVFQDTFY